MRVKSLVAKDFRRFTDLTIQNLPSSARLVVIAGPNGNGKSSLFDAFARFRYRHVGHHGWAPTYHSKVTDPAVVPAQDSVGVEFHEQLPSALNKLFYIRTAYRNDPEFKVTGFSFPQSSLNEHRIARLIDNDATVSLNYQRLYAQSLAGAFEGDDENKTLKQFRMDTIGSIQKHLHDVLPELTLLGLGDPSKTQTFRFAKGTSPGFNYMNLSGGEKSAFDLILDFVVKKMEFDDTVFCIDEPEAHLNPRVHGRMLKTLYDLADGNRQLWVATHSIGMLRQARDLYHEKPGEVVFLDFEKDFDVAQVLEPVVPDRSFWQRSLSVALDDLAELVAPKTIVACEGGVRDGTFGAGFDADIYNSIFSTEFPETRFVSIGSSTDMRGDRFLVVQAVAGLLEGTSTIKLIDRDGMTQQEINEHEADGYRVLRKRHLEAYLFDDEILQKLCDKNGQPEKFDELKTAKTNAIEAAIASGHDADDIKKSGGRLKAACQRILGLQNAGNTTRAFLRDTIAPLVTAETAIYAELKSIIFR